MRKHSFQQNHAIHIMCRRPFYFSSDSRLWTFLSMLRGVFSIDFLRRQLFLHNSAENRKILKFLMWFNRFWLYTFRSHKSWSIFFSLICHWGIAVRMHEFKRNHFLIEHWAEWLVFPSIWFFFAFAPSVSLCLSFALFVLHGFLFFLLLSAT